MAQSQGVLGCETVGSNRAKQVCTHTTERTAVVSFSVRYDGLICVFYLGCVCVLCSDDNDVISPVIWEYLTALWAQQVGMSLLDSEHLPILAYLFHQWCRCRERKNRVCFFP